MTAHRVPMSAPPERAVRAQVLGCALALGVVVAAVGVWAFLPLPAFVGPEQTVRPLASAPNPAATISPLHWAVDLAPGEGGQAASTMVKPVLLSILRRGETWQAAIDPGDGSGLTLVTAGASLAGGRWQVVAVDAQGVTVRGDQGEQRLELAR
ncbi:MAG: hypothetical protein L6R48_01230 [Planctomycetes bacterium]|nr:hypothetical protein [Planctomycetota bacterium]